ncbi:MAG: isoprenylcysteine carboxylmethyltransferase family protein [Anaerolineales bacterium]|nr:isoprenylcysteine carboxylmethyltransferase family protein [Anaerolineales bacterium]GER79192.1 isoprenylcysteine carboxylmethyltransferase family protein [Candidatus Denitrolinea symbiosum]
MLDTIFVIALFLLYMLLWKVKKLQQKRSTGIDPDVMGESTSNIQQFMNRFTKILTAYAAIMILLHAVNIQVGSLFSRYQALSSMAVDVTGFIVGLIGLSFCLYAQIKMGAAWRVGIDEIVKTELITTGLYAVIRNPTYLGLFLLNIGVWLIWPTWTIFLLNILFILFLEIQVRCEEDYLSSVHGEEYREYKKRTKRYVPFFY